MAINLEKIAEELDKADSGSSAATSTFRFFQQGKAAELDLSTEQKQVLKERFTEQVTAARDAAQAVLDELEA